MHTSSYTNDSKSATSFTAQPRSSANLSWDGATFSFDSAGIDTWDSQTNSFTPLTKHATAFTNE